MQAPYPQFVFDFTAGRGIAKLMNQSDAKALVSHLDGHVTGSNTVAVEIVKELNSLYQYDPTFAEMDGSPLIEAAGRMSAVTAKGLVAALTDTTTVLDAKASELLNTISAVHSINTSDRTEAEEALLVCSVIYTLPRMTGVVSVVSEHVRAKWGEMSVNTQNELRSVITEAISAGRTGHPVDHQGWVAVIDHANSLEAVSHPNF